MLRQGEADCTISLKHDDFSIDPLPPKKGLEAYLIAINGMVKGFTAFVGFCDRATESDRSSS